MMCFVAVALGSVQVFYLNTNVLLLYVVVKYLNVIMHMWQSRIEVKYYSVMYFECITDFDAL